MIISKAEAINQGLEFYYSGRRCVSGNSVPRSVKNASCPCDECRARRSKTAMDWNKKNNILVNRRAREANSSEEGKARRAAIDARYKERNPELIVRRKKDWYDKNTSEILARVKIARIPRRESMLAKARQRYDEDREFQISRTREWQRLNPEKLKAYLDSARPKINARAARRRFVCEQATPGWASQDAMLSIYVECERLRRETGDAYEVDHIVPLQSKRVCGLHCEANLQILPMSANRSKSNRHWPGMP